MNRLGMGMVQKAREAGRRLARKVTLRRMMWQVNIVQAHARRQRDLLAKRWARTDLSPAEAQQISRSRKAIRRVELVPS
jgi:hypothetical protein